ncbi:hypothetical protein IWX49DRAFT_580616 [Phyllosticta citricarpa]
MEFPAALVTSVFERRLLDARPLIALQRCSRTIFQDRKLLQKQNGDMLNFENPLRKALREFCRSVLVLNLPCYFLRPVRVADSQSKCFELQLRDVTSESNAYVGEITKRLTCSEIIPVRHKRLVVRLFLKISSHPVCQKKGAPRSAETFRSNQAAGSCVKGRISWSMTQKLLSVDLKSTVASLVFTAHHRSLVEGLCEVYLNTLTSSSEES